MLLADEAIAQATTTANTSLALSVCTIVVVPVLTLFITKMSERWKQSSELAAAKAKLDADAVIARAKIEAEASVAKATIELQSKVSLLEQKHEDCLTNHAQVEKKLEACVKQHESSEQDRSNIWNAINELKAASA